MPTLSPRRTLATAFQAVLEGRETAQSDNPRLRASRVADYVSVATLAARLDCSKTTIHGYVRRGILPRPIRIGELVRWRWVDVEKHIESLEGGDDSHAHASDPYIEGLERGTAEEADDHAATVRQVR